MKWEKLFLTLFIIFLFISNNNPNLIGLNNQLQTKNNDSWDNSRMSSKHVSILATTIFSLPFYSNIVPDTILGSSNSPQIQEKSSPSQLEHEIYFNNIKSNFDVKSYKSTNPISIKNDSAFGPSGYNFPGSGTLEDPYIITGYNITASSNILIEVDSTSVHYVIRDNYFNGISGNSPLTRFYNTTNGTIKRNILINGQKGIFCYSTVFNVTISDNFIYNNSIIGMQISASLDNHITNNYINGSQYGLFMNGSDFNIFSENAICNNSDGIFSIYSDNNTFTSNQIYNNSQFGCLINFDSDNNTILSNDIYNNSYLGVHLYGYNNSINRNNFIDNFLSGGTKSQAQDNGSSNVFIFNHWSDWISPDSNSDGYVDIAYSIDGFPGNLDPYPLRYSFKGYIPHSTISITSNLQFGPSGYNFPGSGTASNPYLIQGYNITHSTNDLVYIINTNAYFTIKDCFLNGAPTVNWAIFLTNVANGNIENNYIGFTKTGIFLQNAANNNTISNNIFYKNAQDAIELASNPTSSYDNKISGNTIFNSSRYGILLGYVYNNTLENNIVYNSSDWGIRIESSDNNTLINNTIFTNVNIGIQLGWSDNNTLIGNRIFNHSQSGIVLWSSNNNTLVGNILANNTQYGIHFWASSENNASRNILKENTQYGILVDSSSIRNIIELNNFWGNNLGNVQASDTGSTNIFIYNYWDDHTGPDTTPVDGYIDNPYNIDGGSNTDPYPRVYSLFPHKPIYIDKNNDFIALGFPGDGTKKNPYIIENYFIINSSNTLIEIHNTTAYFIIQTNLLDAINKGVTGIATYNITNGIIRKNTIKRCYHAIGLSGTGSSTNNFIIGNNISDNSHAGIYLYNNAYKNRISDNTIYNNTDINYGIGFQMENCQNNTIHNNSIFNMGNWGIWINNGDRNNFTHNIINYTVGLVNSDFNRLDGNIVVTSVRSGIDLVTSTNNIILNNVIYEHSQNGIRLRTNSISNNIMNNTIYQNTWGIFIESGSNNNVLSNNRVYDQTALYGIRIETTGNIIYNNSITSNSGTGVSLSAGSNTIYLNNIFNNIGNQANDDNGGNIFYYNGFGNYWGTAYEGYDINKDGIGDTSYAIPGIPGNIDSYPLFYPTEWFFTYSITIINGDWTITGYEVHQDKFITLNGNLLIQSGGNLTLQNVILRMNCSVNGEYRVEVNNGGNLTIQSKSVITPLNSSYAWYLKANSGCTILLTNSTFNYAGWEFGSSGDHTGLWINTNDAQIFNCTIMNNYFGLYLYQVYNLNLSTSWIYNNSNYGVFVEWGGYLNFVNNTIFNNPEGFYLSNPTYVSIHNNTMFKNNFGVRIFNTADNINITDNLFYNNSEYAIQISDSSINNTVSDNIIRYSGTHGLYISSDDNLVFNNTIYSVNQFFHHGIHLAGGGGNVIYNNTIYNVYHGIHVGATPSVNNLSFNHISYSTIGVYFGSTDNCLVYNNTIHDSMYGIFFDPLGGISNNTIDRNFIYSNSEYGIYLEGSTNNTISNNSISSNSNSGIHFTSWSNNNTIIRNKIDNNAYGITLTSSSGFNRIYQNNIFNNTYLAQAQDDNGTNLFAYNGFGNYWGSAYTGIDANNDGIGDSPYIFTGNQDPYPLMFPFGVFIVIKGDWIVTGDEYRNDEIIILSGNLTISSTGNLTLHNVFLWMNCSFDGQYHIEVNTGGKLVVEYNSSVTAVNTSHAWFLKANSGSTLQLKNSTFSYAGWEYGTSGDHCGIWINTDYSEIIGCEFHDSFYGLYFHYADFSTVNDCIIRNINQKGIHLWNSNNNSFLHNTINNTSLSYAIYMYSSWNNTYLANTIYEGYAEGIHMEGCSHNNFSHNIITQSKGSQGHGISIAFNSDFNYLYNNSFFNNDKFGIIISNAYNNTLLENRIYNNKAPSTYAIYMVSSDNNSILGNFIFENEGGVYISDSFINNISYNKIYNNNDPGMFLIGSSYNIIANNNIYDNNEFGIQFQGSCYNNSLNHNNISNNGYSGIYLWGCENNTIFKNYLFQNGWEGIALSDSNYTIITYNKIIGSTWGVFISSNNNFNNLIERNAFIDNYQAASQVFDDDSTHSNIFRYNYYNDWIIPDTNIDGIVEIPYPILGAAGNTDPYPLTYFYVTRDIIEIDENSDFSALGFPGSGTKNDPYLIDGMNITSSTTNAISISFTNVYFIISNSLLKGTGACIELVNTTHCIISNNIVRYASDGIYVYGSNDTFIQNNLAFNNTWYGISLYSSTNCTVRGNEIHDNGHYGIALLLSSTNISVMNNNLYNIYGYTDQGIQVNNGINHTISNNTISDYILGIILVSSSQKNTISDNLIASNSMHGIYLSSSCHYNKMINNTIVNNNDYGIILYSSSYNIISENNISFNGLRGIVLYISCFYNQIFNNTIYNNSVDGILIQQSIDNDIIDNEIYNHSQRGILIYLNSNRTTISNNNLYNNNQSIFIHTSSHNSIARNSISNNIGSGIVLYNNSILNVISENTVCFNTNYGIIMNGSCNNNTISGNMVYNNSISGIALGYSNNNTISNNIVFNNNELGIGINASSCFNTIIRNIIYNNSQYGIRLIASSNNFILNNSISDTNGYGVFIEDALASGNLIKWNDFNNNNPGSSQACDNGTSNIFEYNYWSDWTTPDYNLDGIVDIHYSIAGTANNFDEFPLTISAIHDISNPILVYPNGGEIISGVITVEWDAAVDSLNHDVKYNLYYSVNGGTTWILLISNLTTSSLSWNTLTVVDGTNYLIRVNASCSENLRASDDSDDIFTINNGISDLDAPVIISYATNISFHELTTGNNLSWTATDLNPDTYSVWQNKTLLYNQYTWTDNTPITIQLDGLAPGIYNFTIIIMDTNNNFVVDEVWVTVIENIAPEVTVTYPDGGERVTGPIGILWTASDELPGTELRFWVYYWNGHNWDIIAENITATSVNWDTRNVVDRSDYKIRVNASDGYLIGSDDSNNTFTVDNDPTSERIPIGQTTFHLTDTITIAINVTAEVDVTINLLTQVTTLPPEDADPLGIYFNITVSDPAAVNGLWINVSFSELGDADPANVKIYYYNEQDERWYLVKKTGVDYDNEIVWGWANHLTLFGVMDVQVQPPDLLSTLILLVIIVVPVVVIVLFIYRRTKQQLRLKKVKKEVRKAQIDLGILKDIEKD